MVNAVNYVVVVKWLVWCLYGVMLYCQFQVYCLSVARCSLLVVCSYHPLPADFFFPPVAKCKKSPDEQEQRATSSGE